MSDSNSNIYKDNNLLFVGLVGLSCLFFSEILTYVISCLTPIWLRSENVAEFGSLLLSSVFFALILKKYEKTQVDNRRREEAAYWLNLAIPNVIKNCFKRRTEWNYEKPNPKAFYDNSHINALFDVLEKYDEKISLYRDWLPMESLGLQLIPLIDKFNSLIQSAYINSEELFNKIKSIVDVERANPNLDNENIYKRYQNLLVTKVVQGFDDQKNKPVSYNDYDPTINFLDNRVETISVTSKIKSIIFSEDISKLVKKVTYQRRELINIIKKINEILT